MPLTVAVYGGLDSFFDLLIEYGANPALVTFESMCVIEKEYKYSMDKGDEVTVNKLVSNVIVNSM